MISFCIPTSGCPRTAPRARTKLVVWSQYESPRTKVDSIEKERKGRTREQKHRRSSGQGKGEEGERKRTGRRKLLRGLLRTSQSSRPQLGPPFCFISLRF